MRFLKFDVGQQHAGSVVEVTLTGVESDVFLVDDLNFQKFSRGRDFRYLGGHYDQSPVRISVPHLGQWTAVVIPSGGRVKASVAVL